MRKAVLLAAVAAPVASLWALPAIAQEAGVSANTSTSSGEIIVTARKRQESALKVPVVESVLTPEILEKRQIVDIRGARTQHFRGRRIVEQRQQQMLHGYEFVALLAGFHEGHVQADFEFLGNHLSRFTFNFLPSHTVTDADAVWRTTAPARPWLRQRL